VDSKLINIGGHGLGDCILSLQISYLLKQKNIPHINLISTRQSVFEPLYSIFHNEFDLYKIDEKYSHNNAIISDESLRKELEDQYSSNNITYNVPDLLYRNPLALDYKKYDLNISLIKKTRSLVKHFPNKQKMIYCGLCSTTEGYVYYNIPILLKQLAEFLPDYTIYFPLVKAWDKPIDNLGNFDVNFPPNVLIDNNPSFCGSLEYLKKSCYGIFTCNGPSHIAYQMGIPRLILDPQFNKIPWMSRWKEDYQECIDINTQYTDVVNLVTANIKNPETTLIDRKKVLELIKNGYNNWKDIFFFKY